MSRYVAIPAESLYEELDSIGTAVTDKGGEASKTTQGREVVWDLIPPSSVSCVRVYTSLAIGSESVRGCGKDALRIVVGTRRDGKFRPLAPSRRIYRTAPNGPEAERVKSFLARLRVALREAYVTALRVPSCPKCSSAMVLRTAKGSGEFYGCVSFPECRGTRQIPSRDGNSNGKSRR